MNTVRIVNNFCIAAESRPKPTPIVGKPVQLKPVPFGTRDHALAKGVCLLIREATPPTEIPFHPVKDRTLRRVLTSYHLR